MTHFVHLADSRKIGRIAKLGILPTKLRRSGEKGVFCVPVARDYFRTHQWLRELKRRNIRSLHAVQFALPPNTMVRIGRYNEVHIEVAAAEAAGIFQQHESGLGLEVIVTHGIPRKSILRIYAPSQVIGWRFYPEAKGKQPFCLCAYCNRGQINARKIIDESINSAAVLSVE
jgi:hypothetical protein